MGKIVTGKFSTFFFNLVTCFAIFSLSIPAFPAAREGGFGGLEYLGSSQISRAELEKLVRLKPGASYESCVRCVEKLQLYFDNKAVKASVELVPDGGNYYVAVDIAETGFKKSTFNRQLIDTKHVYMRNEKPFALLQDLKTRLQKLVDEGRPTSEKYQDGIRLYEDVACLNITENLMKELKGQTPYIFKILESDPNGERRAQATEMLNWCPDPIGNCVAVIPALDDSDMRVRMAAAKYIWARTNMLPDIFPFDDLLEGLSHQLARPTHHDRVRALAALIALAKRDPDSLQGIKDFDSEKLREIAETSVIPSVQNSARQLLAACQNPPPPKRAPKHPGAEF